MKFARGGLVALIVSPSHRHGHQMSMAISYGMSFAPTDQSSQAPIERGSTDGSIGL
jgi:hypothetical protein